MHQSLLRTVVLSLTILLCACGVVADVQASPHSPVTDTDNDGVPDNKDAAPNDPLCSAPSDASGGVCYVRTLAQANVRLVGNADGKIYLYAEGVGTPRLYGYDLATQHFTGRTDINYTATAFAYSAAHGRVYTGDATGKIRCYNEALHGCVPNFATLERPVRVLAAAGKYLYAEDENWKYIFNKKGQLTVQEPPIYDASTLEWSPGESRLYYVDFSFPADNVFYLVIDQSSGQITEAGSAPWQGAYALGVPIRPNPDSTKLLLGSGDIYDTPGLNWRAALGETATDAAWLANGQFVTVAPAGDKTQVSRFTAANIKAEEFTLSGQVLGIAMAGGTSYLVRKLPDRVEFKIYQPSDDTDGDGVQNLSDKFPNDKTAAVDSDNDGYPDAFLGGYTPGDSPTGLTLDAYPSDASCHAPSEGDGQNCNAQARNPAYVPDQILDDGQGTIFLLNKANNRVYRWSVANADYLPPYVVGKITSAGLRGMAYSAEHGRLYFGYDSGLITYVNLTGDSKETRFSATAGPSSVLASTGQYLFAQDQSMGERVSMQYVLDQQASLRERKEESDFTGDFDWSPEQSRLYYFALDLGINFMRYEPIDQATGAIGNPVPAPEGDPGYPTGPIRVGPGSALIAIGNGDIYRTTDLRITSRLDTGFLDATWMQDGSLATLAQGDTANSRVSFYNPSLVKVSTQDLPGLPKAIVKAPDRVIVVSQGADRPQFAEVQP